MKKHSFIPILEGGNLNFHAWALETDASTSRFAKKYVGGYIHQCILHCKKDYNQYFTTLEFWEDLGKKTIQALYKNKVNVDELVKDHHKIGKALLAQYEKIRKTDIRSLSNQELKLILKKLWSDFLLLSKLGTIAVYSDFIILI